MSTAEPEGDDASKPPLETHPGAGRVEAPLAGSVPKAQRAAVYTVMAHQAVNVAELLNRGLHKKTICKDPRHIEVTEPSGPSTQGGKRARQSITLVPISGEGGVIMCGWLDVAQREAELRDYDEVSAQFKQRFGQRFDATREEYEKLMGELRGMIAQLGFQLVEFEEEEDDTPPGRAKMVRVVASLVAATVVAAAFLLLK